MIWRGLCCWQLRGERENFGRISRGDPRWSCGTGLVFLGRSAPPERLCESWPGAWNASEVISPHSLERVSKGKRFSLAAVEFRYLFPLEMIVNKGEKLRSETDQSPRPASRPDQWRWVTNPTCWQHGQNFPRKATCDRILWLWVRETFWTLSEQFQYSPAPTPPFNLTSLWFQTWTQVCRMKLSQNRSVLTK